MFQTPLKWFVMFTPLLAALGLGAVVSRMPAAATAVAFHDFSAVMGVALSTIFVVYTDVSILWTLMARRSPSPGFPCGLHTQRDLSGWRSFLVMGVIGLIVAMVVNLFLRSSAVVFAVNCLGVLIFAGLTARETQQIKLDYVDTARHGGNWETMEKAE